MTAEFRAQPRDRLDRPGLVIDPHQRCEPDRRQPLDSDHPGGIDRERMHDVPALLQHLHRLGDARMLDGTRQNRTRGFGNETEHREVIGFGRPGGENDLGIARIE